MALAYENNTSLAFDTDAFRKYGKRYGGIADDLRKMSKNLTACLEELENTGWTTPAGSAFNKMVNTNWSANIGKYAELLDTLQGVLEAAATEYEDLVRNHIEKTVI